MNLRRINRLVGRILVRYRLAGRMSSQLHSKVVVAFLAAEIGQKLCLKAIA